MKKLSATELRIGNIIGFVLPDKPVIVSEILMGSDEYFIETITIDGETGNAGRPIEDFCTIPLTEEKLVEFGFEYREDLCGNGQDYYNGYVKNGFRIAVIGDEFAYWIDVEDYYYSFALRKIKYVHKLQNLYFEIKNEELI